MDCNCGIGYIRIDGEVRINLVSRSDHFSSRQWSHTTATIFATSLNSRHHPFNGRRSSNRGGASDCAPFIR
ncbi:hypothetical protein N7537_002300 [Penicillium hordei]|uniref:Uncharacterized protein n=1 Tax=Penicillium hordei TaxID=40994 RepID=A0AAD6EH59_9EURO|nr:uncharacterized protein N7537_002300 [Penicillium hordei]KAJ5617186.1 hypothetical protein N7537_002300 [Penicillium hordei]